jgi:hypothetical protein
VADHERGDALKRPVLILSAVALVAAVMGAALAAVLIRDESGTKVVVRRPCGDRIFGHIDSLEARGNEFVLQFDPAWFTSGTTANVAAAEDGAVEPGEPVPNDNYVVEEGHRLLRYAVPASARVTVLTRGGIGPLATPITVAELERIVNGGPHRPLFEPLDSGVWHRAHVDRACSLEQQYRP